MIPYNIPAHTRCINCGECCGMIPASPAELQRIKNYLQDRPDIREKAQKNAHVWDSCPFRDSEAKRCMIYPVRPVVCVLMGVCSNMQCVNGTQAI